MNLATATLVKGPIGIYCRYSGICSSLSIAQKMIHTTTSGLHPPRKKLVIQLIFKFQKLKWGLDFIVLDLLKGYDNWITI